MPGKGDGVVGPTDRTGVVIVFDLDGILPG